MRLVAKRRGGGILFSEVLSLLRSNPLGQATIAQMVGAKTSTLQARLRRLEAKGLVQRGDGGLWSSTSTLA
jgi:DNA-binding MarR family transcriptional regulator